MSEELQNESFEIEPEVVEETTTPEPAETNENPESGSELAPETTNEVVEETEEQKEVKRQAAFNKQYGEKMQLKRDKDALEAQLAQMQQQTQQPPPDPGQMPNEYDYDTQEEFNTATQTFLANVRANERHAAQQEANQAYQQTKLQEEQQQRNLELQQQSQKYGENGVKNGISKEELFAAGTAVRQYGISDDLVIAIINEPDGALMTKYLAANPQEVSLLNNMNPYQAGSYMQTTLKEKAGALKPKQSNAPPPPTNLSGNGAEDKDHYQNLEGVKFS